MFIIPSVAIAKNINVHPTIVARPGNDVVPQLLRLHTLCGASVEVVSRRCRFPKEQEARKARGIAQIPLPEGRQQRRRQKPEQG